MSKASFFLFNLIILNILCADAQKKVSIRDRPNIIIILADDLGYGDPTCYSSSSKIPTPNIDALAKEGIRFTDAHSPDAVCTPTRYSILTGQYSWRSRLKNSVLWAWDEPLIKSELLTLPEMLKEIGYKTAAIGKWHLGWNWPTLDSLTAKEGKGENVDYTKLITGGPLAHGFDYYFGDDVPNFPPYTFIENQRVVAIPNENKPNTLFGSPGKMVHGWSLEQVMPTITKKSVDFIQSSALNGNPFFLYFALTAPHTPIAPLPEFAGKSKAGRYGDFVFEVDWAVGQILKTLTENNLNKNTLVIFTSDNGSPGRNGNNYSGPTQSVVTDYGHNPSGPFRGMKADIWEGGHRVPFIAKWFGKIQPETVTEALTTSMDIMPTIAEIIGYKLPKTAAPDAQSMLKVLKGEEKEGRKIILNHSISGVFAIRKGNWKLILSNKSGGFSDNINPEGYGIETPGQLYRLDIDPGEKNNLYSEYPTMVKKLTKKLKDIQGNDVLSN